MAQRTVTKLRLENTRNNALSFCDLTLDGCKLLVVYGNTRDGKTTYAERTGQRFPTADAAALGMKRVLEVRGRHYKEQKREDTTVEGDEETLAPAASDAALEAAVVAGRDNAASVFADWLQQRGDVRGELAALALAGRWADVTTFVAAYPTRLFGELDVKLDGELYDLDWSGGFLTGASLRRASMESPTDLAEMTRAFLALPVARFVRRLRFGLDSFESDNNWTSTMEAVASSVQAPHLTSLRFDDFTSEDCEISWTAFGDFSAAWARLPALEELVIRSGEGGTLGTLELPALKTFVRQSGGLAAREIQAILAATWPRLEKLEIWFGSAGYNAEGSVAMLAPLLDGRVPPTLVHLGLRNAEFTHELVPALAASPLTRKLRVLDLSMGVLRDSDADVLLAHADAFRHLERFDLSENQLVDRRSDIRAALPTAVLDGQRDDDGDRYAALGE